MTSDQFKNSLAAKLAAGERVAALDFIYNVLDYLLEEGKLEDFADYVRASLVLEMPGSCYMIILVAANQWNSLWQTETLAVLNEVRARFQELYPGEQLLI